MRGVGAAGGYRRPWPSMAWALESRGRSPTANTHVPRRALGMSPVQFLVSGYLLVTLAVTFLLMLPAASTTGRSQSFLDAFFMACSGISTTGLSVVDVGTYYTRFGQIALMLDFQVGGLGYMAFVVMLAALFDRRLSLTHAMVAGESVVGFKIGHTSRFFGGVIAFTAVIELAGTAMLFWHWLPGRSVFQAAYLAAFHSISAFCTAGFCLFPDSLMSYRNDLLMNAAISTMALLGGIGFCVLDELYAHAKRVLRFQRPPRLSEHSRLALIVTFIVLLWGTAMLMVCEPWPSSATVAERLTAASFQAVTASTTDGFNTLDIGALSTGSLLALILLMFVGASPGSTGGGMKTTTLGVIVKVLWSQVRGRRTTAFAWRQITPDLGYRALAIFFLFVTVAMADLFVLAATEGHAGFLPLLFETVSALANTGLSTGITATLSDIGKLTLSLTMFIGRVGPLTLGLALMRRASEPDVRSPEAEIHVG